MARKARDYKAEYARRVARARAEGYTGYSQKRRAQKAFRSRAMTPGDRRIWDRTFPDETPEDVPRAYAAFYKAFIDPPESRRDQWLAKKHYFVDAAGVMDSDEWDELYPMPT